MLPSYIIRTIKQMFQGIITLKEDDVTDQLSFIRIPKSELVYEKDVFTGDLGEALALRLYGDTLYGSVSSFENFTGCMFSYYLNHGLLLKERDIYSFEVSDFGNVMHSLLEQICIDVKSKSQSISSLSDEERLKLVTAAIEKISATYSDSILSDSNRNRFLVDRMTKLADKTLWLWENSFLRGCSLRMDLRFHLRWREENWHLMMVSADLLSRARLTGLIYVRTMRMYM